jgi:hypothetical protein
VRIALAVLALVLSGSVAMAASIPLPRPRPESPGHGTKSSAGAPAPDAAQTDQGQPEAGEPEAKSEAAAGPAAPSPCRLALRTIADFAPHTPVKGSGACGIADPVTLEAVVLSDKARVAVNPPAVLRCDMATAVSQWIREEMAPLAAHLGAPLRGIENYDSYDCRGRNRVVGAKLSEHGRGNALDIKALKLADGTIAQLTDTHVARDVRAALRQSACSRFMTVLGPGSDGYHENHIHVDLAERRADYRMCEWAVRQPIDNAAPSPLLVSSRSPTPHETMPSGVMIPVAALHSAIAAPAKPAARRASKRQ